MKTLHRTVLFGVCLALLACTPGQRWFSLGPRPPELSGEWIDSGKTTATDTSVWVLTPGGRDQTLHITVRQDAGSAAVERKTTDYGFWYTEGSLADSSSRALCIKRRARDGGTCYAFRLDTVRSAENGMRRRLLVGGYKGNGPASDRVLTERQPPKAPHG